MEDVKVINENGTVKWFSKTLVDNVNFMKREGYKVFESPVFMGGILQKVIEAEEIKDKKVANFAGAKQGRKPKK